MRSTSNAPKRRPVESTEDEELSRRRERGRLAQQAFRQRQVDAIARLDEEVASLKSSLGDITSLAEELDASLSKSGTGLSTTAAGASAKQTMDQLLERLRRVTNAGSNSAEDSIPETASKTTLTSPSTIDCTAISLRPAIPQTSNPQLYSDSSGTDLMTSGTRESGRSDQETSTSNSTSIYVQTSKTSSSNGRLSPRLNYGLWFEPDPGLPIVVPPEDIIPFLNGAESPFVIKLYWRTLMFALSLLRNHWRRRGNMSPDAAMLTNRIFGKSLQYDSGEVIAATMHARLGFYLRGKIEATHPGRDPVNALRLHHMIQSDLRMRGETMAHWLDARQVERLIGDLYGLHQVMLLQVASTATADAATVQRTTRLVEGLARHSSCFGDGPRYRLQDVTTVLQQVFDDGSNVLQRVDTVF
ncbi:hypothetical protein H2200_006536 [Cladophialophora chaetospira]|uniref:BZIP domain-containing protein n=1 Tax=Cladophialophora chaetospira TaxID=386627 RepID=A0AA38X8K3_9EURO|nr:hypothetical protein H2200_006536 [Cladophialophora chaetospira]